MLGRCGGGSAHSRNRRHARPANPPSPGAPGSRSARADKTVEAIRAFLAAEPAPVYPEGLEEARVAARLAPFPVRGTPRMAAWEDVQPGSIVWAPALGTPEIAVRWADGGGAWVDCEGPFYSSWSWGAGKGPDAEWVVAEGLSDNEIRVWLEAASAAER